METMDYVAVTQRYWAINDEINAVAREMRPSGSGSHNARDFMLRIEAIEGYSLYFKQSLKFRSWFAEQRSLVAGRKLGHDPRFVMEYTDPVTGARVAPTVDIQKATEFFRSNPMEFFGIIK